MHIRKLVNKKVTLGLLVVLLIFVSLILLKESGEEALIEVDVSTDIGKQDLIDNLTLFMGEDVSLVMHDNQVISGVVSDVENNRITLKLLNGSGFKRASVYYQDLKLVIKK